MVIDVRAKDLAQAIEAAREEAWALGCCGSDPVHCHGVVI